MAIKDISSKPKKFKIALKHYLLAHSFYSLDEFFFSKQEYLTLTVYLFYIFTLYNYIKFICTYSTSTVPLLL